MVKGRLERNLFNLFLFTILAFPSLHYLPIDGLPFDSFRELFLLSAILIIAGLLYPQSKKIVVFITLLLLASKIILAIEPPSYWKTCFLDDLSPSTQKFEYEDISVLCEKDFSLLPSKLSGYEPVIDFHSVDTTQSWRGSNNSTFPLSFFNSKKFNFDRRYEPRREWLPFRALLYADIDSRTSYLKFDYVGQVSVKFDNGDTGFGFPDSYLDEGIFVLEMPKDARSIKVDYRFNKTPPVLWDETLQINYPKDPYAKLVISESTNGLDWVLLKSKIEGRAMFANYLYISASLLLFLFFVFKKLKNISIFHVGNIFFFIFLFSLIRNIELVRELPVIGVIDTSTGALLFISAIYIFLSRKEFANYFLLIFCYFMNLLLVDYPWGKLNFYIKPGGSDSLTYESQARLIMLGDGLRGGEDIFFYSPGYRYILNILHVFFGDTWTVAWYSLISICLFFFLKVSIELLRSENLMKFIFPMFGFIYLTSNSVQTIFRYGMSETISAVVLCILFYFIFSHLPMIKTSKVMVGVLVGVGIVVRPDWLLGFVILLMMEKFRSSLIYSITGFISLLPLAHNLYYGKEFVIFSTAATYGRNLLVDTSTLTSFTNSLIETISRNVPYLFMNPFNQDISGRVGSILPFVFLLALLSCFALLVVRFKELSNMNTFLIFIAVFGFFAPFFLYDPVLFYPRHVLGAHIAILFFLIHLSSSLNKAFSPRIITKDII